MIRKNVCILVLIGGNSLFAQQNGYLNLVTDAIAAGQGEIGVATSTDVFSQFWNPSKYVFSKKKCEVGITQIREGTKEQTNFSQIRLNYYNKPSGRNAYGISFRGYASSENNALNPLYEIALDGSYTLKLSYTFALSIASRIFYIKDNTPIANTQNNRNLMYGIDVSGFYFGNELAFMNFNGRWRAGFNISNLRSTSIAFIKNITSYAPTTFRMGTGFDFIFNKNEKLAMTTEYKTLIGTYIGNPMETKPDPGAPGSLVALGITYGYQEKIIVRTGYSYGLNLRGDSFTSLGLGLRGKHITIDGAILIGVSEKENPKRKNLRISLTLDLEKVFSAQK